MALGDVNHFVEVLQLLFHNILRLVGGDVVTHGFPGNNVHDEVWTRPTMESKNPIPDCRLIIGHTKVLSMIQPEEKRIAYAMDLEDKGEHLEILHTPGFVNLDCGCGYNMPIKALACIRLEDMCEFYA